MCSRGRRTGDGRFKDIPGPTAARRSGHPWPGACCACGDKRGKAAEPAVRRPDPRSAERAAPTDHPPRARAGGPAAGSPIGFGRACRSVRDCPGVQDRRCRLPRHAACRPGLPSGSPAVAISGGTPPLFRAGAVGRSRTLPGAHLPTCAGCALAVHGAAAARSRGGHGAYFWPAFFSTQAVISSISGPWASMIFWAIAFDCASSPYFSSTSAMAMAPA